MLDEKACFPKSAFSETCWIPFCNTKVPAPKDYDAVLKAKYGDYHKTVKAGGGHGYPFFKKHIDQLKSALKDKWACEYLFSEEDLVHKKEDNFRDMVLETWKYLEQKNKKIFESFMTGDFALCLQLMGQMQEEAIAFGNAIEAKIGEGSESVSYLEKYCEALFHSYRALEQALPLQEESKEKKGPAEGFPASLWKDLQNIVKKPSSFLKKLKLSIEKDFKRVVLFLPSRFEQLKSFQALYDSLCQMEDVECKIMPIPYFDRLGTGALGEMHYEGEEFQKLYPILDYKSYDFATERPDCIVIHSPYDEHNQVFSVDPFFFSKNMKNFTNKLVYLPAFVTDEIDPKNEEDGKAFGNMEYYVTVPGIFHADFTIVQSEAMRKSYLAKISAFTNSSVRKQMAKKISGAGSCLFGEEERGSKAVISAFRRFLMKKEDKNN
jgi:possible LPS biosynthesis protein